MGLHFIPGQEMSKLCPCTPGTLMREKDPKSNVNAYNKYFRRVICWLLWESEDFYRKGDN